MKQKTKQSIKNFPHTLFLERFVGKEVHLYLKNRFHYFCRVERIRELNNNIFLEVFDLKKKIYQLFAIDSLSKIEEATQ
ncbi:MAG: hypothetical protein ACTSXY_04340 [Promethearchaeota archaeon]